jgi:hypothetical protein
MGYMDKIEPKWTGAQIKTAENDTHGTSVMETNQNSTNINGKKT